MNLKKTLMMRLSSDSELNRAIRDIKRYIREDNSDPIFACEVLAKLRRKYWLFQGEWHNFVNELIAEHYGDNIIEFDGLSFVADKSLAMEYADIFVDEKRVETDRLLSLILGWNIADGCYQTEEVAIKEGDTVIDAGANMGLFSVMAARMGAAKIYAFEPVAASAEKLRRNLELNNITDKVIIEPLGVSECECTVKMFVEGGAAASFVIERGGRCESVRCVSVDEWVGRNGIDRVDFIKADVEGAERLMLKGAQETLKKFAPRLAICTYHLPDDPEVIEGLILKANPAYKIYHTPKKIFAKV
ncbi:methyltransferase [Mucinivorans hirudinis]|uniref:Methyltransferase n=1 Tax=Mucinivorans hirudinis TaxID=1433126 RepID=A0A060R7Z3_9BACT|nr:methyltransferase [Mucinivorans hirudinis]